MPLKVYVFGLRATYEVKSEKYEYYDLLEDDLREAILSNISQLQNLIQNSSLITDKVKIINFLGYKFHTATGGGQKNQWTINPSFSVLISVHTTLDEPKIKRHIYSLMFYNIVENWFRSFNLGEVAEAKNTAYDFNPLAYESHYPYL